MKKEIILVLISILFLFLFVVFNPFGNDYFSYQKEIFVKEKHNKKIEDISRIFSLKHEEKLKNNNLKINNFKKNALTEEKKENTKVSKKDYKQNNPVVSRKKNNETTNTININDFNKLIEETNKNIIDKKYNEAIAGLTSIINYYPKHPNGYIARANIYFAIQKYNQALDDYKKALSLDNKVNDILYLRIANTEYELQLYKDSISNYILVLNLNPSNSEYIYYKLIGAYIFIEDFNNALDYLNKYLELSSSKTINTNDYYKWNNVLNKFKENETIRTLKNNFKKLKFTKTK